MERATKEETVELPDGRLIQVAAEGTVINERLMQQERDMAEAARTAADRSADFIITPETDVIAEGLVRTHVVHTPPQPVTGIGAVDTTTGNQTNPSVTENTADTGARPSKTSAKESK